MPNYSVISNGVVIDYIIAESKDMAELVTGNTCVASDYGIGYSYDENTGVFVAPVLEIPVVEVEDFSEETPTEAI